MAGFTLDRCVAADASRDVLPAPGWPGDVGQAAVIGAGREMLPPLFDGRRFERRRGVPLSWNAPRGTPGEDRAASVILLLRRRGIAFKVEPTADEAAVGSSFICPWIIRMSYSEISPKDSISTLRGFLGGTDAGNMVDGIVHILLFVVWVVDKSFAPIVAVFTSAVLLSLFAILRGDFF